MTRSFQVPVVTGLSSSQLSVIALMRRDSYDGLQIDRVFTNGSILIDSHVVTTDGLVDGRRLI